MDEEIQQQLKEMFFVHTFPVEKVDLMITETGLVGKEDARKMVEWRNGILKGKELKVGGASMIKPFSLLFAAHYYLASVKNQWLLFDELAFFSKGKEVGFELRRARLEPLALNDISPYFTALAKRIAPIIENIAEVADLPKTHAFGLLAFPLYQQQSAWLKKETDQTTELRIRTDGEVLKQLSGDAFGLKRNPFDVKFRYVSSWADPNEHVRIKPACCLSYLKEGGNYCYSCPKMNTEQREVRAAQLREQAAQQQKSS
ncbi:(2Fe-2S)-binding protein [Halalkalibacterium halodurans]|uniref:(2Fe-2S)-binding protein n=1 Tax=Halalkalibacterium halodurans TaxID=86665 RepID=UPI002E2112EA|nr:(2Fe-2S)-binding protein [Halalkalibacterium halodurans]MED4086575.1 (2Fe-2S)-binding protein [Halalkalibacterium halodurans]MED4106968.1 (2Fe-2S)-binding protein [Halalkalibacterium halodurans]MED4110317.1 (2Fe-2S)-binding protein [Halalkalibacterium halodurans]MED4149903.1 (2Fe-2S)-binding protein [Halalkalibacterium halodurans]